MYWFGAGIGIHLLSGFHGNSNVGFFFFTFLWSEIKLLYNAPQDLINTSLRHPVIIILLEFFLFSLTISHYQFIVQSLEDLNNIT